MELDASLAALAVGDFGETDIKMVKSHLREITEEELMLRRNMETEKNLYSRSKEKKSTRLRKLRKEIKEIKKILDSL